jgi:UPF0755 protein
MKLATRRAVRLALGAAGVCLALALGAFAYYATARFPDGSLPVQFSLKAGSSLRAVAQQMVDAGVLPHPAAFVLLARAMGESGNVKAGSYEIDAPLTLLQLLRRVTRGDYTLSTITFVEGWTFKQMRKALDGTPALKHDTLGLSEADILQRLAIAAALPEGLFFPDTYHFSHGTSDLAILRRAHRLMQAHLTAQWEKRALNLPLASPYDALILASIVEKETGRAEERALIASVFVNRLRIGMKLQTDPTVIYGLGDAFDGNLRRRDLVTDTPYNTYTRTGLPPTPIALPGLASLTAVLNPENSDMLYFVARGDGSSHFSRTLAEHDRAVTKYQRSGKR